MAKRKLLIAGLAALTLAAAAGFWYWKRADVEAKWRTAPAERGDIQVSVTATGTLQALVTVQVGTQVSGPIASIHADFNSEVKKGQVIARLDTTLLQAALADARSSYARMEAQHRQAAGELKRARALFERALVSQAELDQAESAAQVAAANLNSAKSQVDRARINLRYATIVSPIDGIVLSRAVDVGQTVAASFNTPTLFTIAGDLREMEVKASVDEADIGKVRAGQKATFTVDAYPDAVFAGSVQQVRLEPKVEQNVVSYDVVIRVPNPDKKLMPGMTANLTLTVTEKRDVVLVPAAALRFRPPSESRGEARSRRERTAGAGNGSDSSRGGDSTRKAYDVGGRNGVREERGGAGEEIEGVQRGRVYVLADGKPSPIRVKVGITDGSRTEVVDGLLTGAIVVVGVEGAAGAAQNSAARPFGLAPSAGRGGSGGRRGM